MKDRDCIAFLQWALPRLDMRWAGFRKVRRQVCKRIHRRMTELGLETLGQYRARLEADPGEWSLLDGFCRITISRFYRDRRVFDVLGEDVLPVLAETATSQGRAVRCWCAGCASGEEVYTLAILWDREIHPRWPGTSFEITGTDSEPVMIERAEKGCFSAGSLKDVPEPWLHDAFDRDNARYCVKAQYRTGVRFALQDIRLDTPPGPFDLLLCRNLVFTYFAPELQLTMLRRFKSLLREDGFLVIGGQERLPQCDHRFRQCADCRSLYRLTARD